MVFISPPIPPATNRFNNRGRAFLGERKGKEEGERQKSYTFRALISCNIKKWGITKPDLTAKRPKLE